MSWSCPLCHAALVAQQGSLRCIQGHQFDVAKEGYVNLLPVQHKKSKEPGDSSDMIQARRVFLDHGYYQPLRDAVCQLLDVIKPQTLLDIGCGEGYYTSAFAKKVPTEGGQVYGLDIAKVAIRYAAKRYHDISFCVASTQRLPFIADSMDAVVRIFAPCNPQELCRVVKPGGYGITVTPGPRHLYQLKALIYQDVLLHPVAVEPLAGFELCQTLSVNGMMTLSGQQAVSLLQMTPFAWRAKPDVWENLHHAVRFECETDFVIHLWRKAVAFTQ